MDKNFKILFVCAMIGEAATIVLSEIRVRQIRKIYNKSCDENVDVLIDIIKSVDGFARKAVEIIEDPDLTKSPDDRLIDIGEQLRFLEKAMSYHIETGEDSDA